MVQMLNLTAKTRPLLEKKVLDAEKEGFERYGDVFTKNKAGSMIYCQNMSKGGKPATRGIALGSR